MEPEMLYYYNSLQEEALWMYNWGGRSGCYMKYQTSYIFSKASILSGVYIHIHRIGICGKMF